MEVCTNLNNAKAGQYVKCGTTGSGPTRVEQIVKVSKTGRITMSGYKNIYLSEREGKVAYPVARTMRYSRSTSALYAFSEDETVEAVQEQMVREAQVQAEARAVKEAEAEAETQRKIAAAAIEHSAGRDLPGSRVARWTDRRGNARMTLYFPKEESMYGTSGWRCAIADYADGSFGSSFATSLVSPEDAANRWIASWW